jgi:ABC-type polysaccharide/polyol phosphate export systems, permease component
VRDVTAKYRQSILGVLWAFLPPVATGLVFIILQSKKIVDFGKTDIPYPVYAITGTIFWQLFTESLNAPLQMVKESKNMLAKINFPHEALIVSAFYQMLFSLGIKMIILLIVLLVFRIHLSWGVIFFPAAVVMIIFLGLTIGLFLTPAGILYTDISSGLTVMTQFWFFVTPVIYPPPQTFPYSLVNTLNPVSPILIGARDLLTKGVLMNAPWFFGICGFTLLGLLVAWLIFHVSIPIIIERMSS